MYIYVYIYIYIYGAEGNKQGSFNVVYITDWDWGAFLGFSFPGFCVWILEM